MEKINVGIHAFAPLTKKEKDGSWSGFEVAMWKSIVQNLGAESVYQEEENFSQILDNTHKGKYDIAFAGITRTMERKEKVRMSFATLESGLAILSRPSSGMQISSFIKKVFNRDLGFIGILLLSFSLIYAHIYWLIERGASVAVNYFPGVFEAVWWSVVTFSTVGYGDIYPESLLGKAFGIFAIVTGLAIFGLYIGNLSASLVLEKRSARIATLRDLAGKRVGTKRGTSSVSFLQDKKCVVSEFVTIADAYDALKKEEIDAVVFDRSVLQYDNKSITKDFSLSDENISYQAYAFIFPKGDDRSLIDAVNKEIIHFHESGEYDKLYNQYFTS